MSDKTYRKLASFGYAVTVVASVVLVGGVVIY